MGGLNLSEDWAQLIHQCGPMKLIELQELGIGINPGNAVGVQLRLREVFFVMGDNRIRVMHGRQGQNMHISGIWQPKRPKIHRIWAYGLRKIIQKLPDRIFSFKSLERCFGPGAIPLKYAVSPAAQFSPPARSSAIPPAKSWGPKRRYQIQPASLHTKHERFKVARFGQRHVMGMIGTRAAGINQLRLPPSPANPTDGGGTKTFDIRRM